MGGRYNLRAQRHLARTIGDAKGGAANGVCPWIDVTVFSARRERKSRIG